MKAIAVTPMSKQISIINMPEPSLSSPIDVKLRMIEAGGAAPIKKSAPSNGTAPPGAADLVIGHESLSEAVEAILYNEPVYRCLDGRDRCRPRARFLGRPSRRQLCRDRARRHRTSGSLPSRSIDYLHFDDRNLAGFKPAATGQIHRAMRRPPGRLLHHLRSPDLRHE